MKLFSRRRLRRWLKSSGNDLENQLGPVGVLLVFAGLFIALTLTSYINKSATWDEPQHLTAGYLALAKRDYRLDPQHPPLLRMWSTLPLLTMRGIRADTEPIDNAKVCEWIGAGQFFYSNKFLYDWNKGDRLLNASRFMIVLLGILLGALVFLWARQLYGFIAAVIVLIFYMLEPNILAHASLVTTDFAITCFAFGIFYFTWRTTRRLTVWNIVGLMGFSAAAVVSKYSAVAFLPVAVVLLLVHAVWCPAWSCRIGEPQELTTRKPRLLIAGGLAVLLALCCWLAIWIVYGFRYLPSASPTWRFRFTEECQQYWPVRQRAPMLARVVTWVDDHHLIPNAYSQGFLLGQARAQSRGTYLLGKVRTEGVWYYFPIAFLVKTPLAVILLSLAGLVACGLRWPTLRQNEIFILTPLLVYTGATLVSNLNIGLRHLLPVYPLLLLLLGKVTAEFLGGMRRIVVVILMALAIVELWFVYPNYLTFFNLAVGGPGKGDRYLVDSNLDWGQDLKGLKRWMVGKGVDQINLSYFGTADPSYYNIKCIFLPAGASLWDSQARAPELPGYVAVSVTNLRGPYFNDAGRQFYKPLLAMRPVAVIGNSIRVYRIDRPWW